MKVSDIPFVKLTGVQEEKDRLSLDFRPEVQNHIQTFHAGAQFTLAEAQVGLFLKQSFPSLEGKVIPVLRESKLKYKKPATTKIYAYTHCGDEELEKFRLQFEKKGRATIEVFVEVKDSNDVLCCEGSFTFFVQGI